MLPHMNNNSAPRGMEVGSSLQAGRFIPSRSRLWPSWFELEQRLRDRALFDFAIGIKLRGSDRQTSIS